MKNQKYRDRSQRKNRAVRTAKSGRDIIAIDGCPSSCCKSCLARHEVQPKHYFVLSEFVLSTMGSWLF
nr:putative zinc-binding protein [Paenibacillus terrae]